MKASPREEDEGEEGEVRAGDGADAGADADEGADAGASEGADAGDGADAGGAEGERKREEADAAPKAASREGARERRARSRRRAERKPQRVAIDVTAAPKARKRKELTVRALVILAAALGASGIAIVGTRESGLGAAMVVGGMLGLIAAIHMFGRLGPDEAV